MAFVLTIRERGNSWAGRDPLSSLHPTRADAEAALADYVRRNWAAEMGDEAPADETELIDRYFEDALEAYEISETTAPANQISGTTKQ